MGNVDIHWYGILLVAGILVGYWIVNHLSRRSGISQETVSLIYINTLICGFIGARIYHVLSDWSFYASNLSQIFAVWNGGLAIHGAIIGAVLCIIYFSRKHHINLWKIMDLFAIAGILGQAIGRWGNYFNQELFGRPTDSALGIPIDITHRPAEYIQSTHFHPAFLYESILNLIVLVVLLFVYKKQKRPNSLVFWLYLGLYSSVRIIVESIRVNEAAMILGLRLPLLVSILLALLSAIMILKALAANNKKE